MSVADKLFLPQDTIFIKTEDGLFLRRGDRSLTIRGKTIHETFTRLVSFLDGSRSIPDICEGLAEPRAKSISALLGDLLKKGFLIGRSARDEETLPVRIRQQFSKQILLLEHLMSEPVAAFARVRHARVCIAGSGWLQRSVARHLIQNGVETLWLERPTVPNFMDELESVADQCGGRVVAVDDAIDSARKGAVDLMVYASEAPDLARAASLFAACSASGVNATSAMILAGAARIGPMDLRAAPGCWNCSFLRLSERLPSQEGKALWRARATGGACIAAGAHPSSPLVDIAGTTVAFRIFQHLAGITAAAAPAPGAVIESIGLLDLHSVVEQVLPHPDCPHCAARPVERPVIALHIDPAAPHPTVDLERWLTGRDHGVFVGFEDDDLPQVPTFRSALRVGGQEDGAALVFGNSLRSNADARLRALFDALGQYALRHGIRTATDAVGVDWDGRLLIDSADVAGVQGVCDMTRLQPDRVFFASGGKYVLKAHAVVPDPSTGTTLDAGQAGLGVAFSWEEAGARATCSLLLHRSVLALARGEFSVQRCSASDLDSNTRPFLELLQRIRADLAVATLEVDGHWVCCASVRRESGGRLETVLGSGATLNEAVADTLPEALSVASGGSSNRTWSHVVPPDAAFDESIFFSSNAGGRAMRLEDLLEAPASVPALIVTCDISPIDARAAGLFVAKAVLVRCPSQAEEPARTGPSTVTA